MFISLLESMKIQAVSINKKGSELLLGSVEVYVREDNLEDAKECLKTFEN
jgi:hypothetical protein